MTAQPASLTIPALLDEQAARHGAREAVIGGSRRLSYQDLRAQARQAAASLLAIGVKPDDKIAILMANTVEWIVACLAIQSVGARVVGLNTWATSRELEYVLGHADVSVVFCAPGFRKNNYREIFSEMRARPACCPFLRTMVWVGDDGTRPDAATDLTWTAFIDQGRRVPQHDIDAAAQAVRGSDVALMLYSSGSTARPKCILLCHQSLIANGWGIGERQHCTDRDRLWLAVSLFWSFGSANAMMNLLTHGGCIVLQEVFDAGLALQLIERERCTLIYGTPNMIQALDEHPERGVRDISSLRSGATIGTPEQLLQAVKLGAHEICNIYGSTETYGNCCVTDASEPLTQRINSVGKPLHGVEVRICDPVTGSVMGPRQTGEIRVKGHLFAGYYKDETATRAAFDEHGYFKSGDLGFLDEQGSLHFRGRIKEMVKSGGINIAPIEVEETMMRFPAVQTAYVVGLPDPVLDEVLAAVVVLRDGAKPCADDLLAFCRHELSAYKVPARLRFVKAEDLPLTSTGKVWKMGMVALFSPVANENGSGVNRNE